MKASKAIEILTQGLPADNWKLEPDLKDAIKLGIEALKRHQKALEGFRVLEPFLLPGETEE